MLALLSKDFKLVFASGKVGKWRILTYVINVLLVAFFVTIETFIVQRVLSILDRANKQAPLAVLSIALFFVSILMMFVCLTQAKKLFFNESDTLNLSNLPVSNSQIIASKLIFLFILQYVAGLLFTYPIIATYAAMFNRGRQIYYLALFYPALAFPFECGVALLLVYPYKLLGDFLKKHSIVQFVVAVAVIFGLCWLYSRVLNIFVTLVASNDFNYLMNADSIAAMVNARRFMLHVNWLVQLFFEDIYNRIGLLLFVSLGVFIIGVTLCVVSFNYLRSIRFNSRAKVKAPSFKVYSVKRALIKKEFMLLFKDSNNLFSFTGLLVVQPFLVYLIISSINTIFTTGIFAYYVAMLSTFLPVIDMLLVILTSLIICQGANSYISDEGKNIRLIKMVPVSVFTQLAIKVMLPLTLVAISTVVTYAVLGVFAFNFGANTWWVALLGCLITLIIQVIFSVISMYEELKIRQNRSRSYFLSSTFSYAIPIVYAAAMIVASYFGLQLFAAFAIGLALVVASGLPWVINFKRRVLRLFNELEVVN